MSCLSKKRAKRLTTQQKIEIKRRALAGENKTALAKEFGVNKSTILYHRTIARG